MRTSFIARHTSVGAALALVALSLLPAGALAQSSDPSFEALQRAERFAPGGVSIDNHRAEQLADLDRVAARGTPALERLFHRASTTEGKLYALLALYALDRRRYETLAARLDPATPVRVQSGCMGYPSTVRDALDDIEGSMTMFPNPTQH